MRHTEFFLDLAEELLAPVGQPTSDERRERFMADQANFREAHTRVLEAGDGASAVRFVRRLGRVMSITGSPPADSYARGIASLALPGATKEDRAYALVRTASCADALVGEYETARALLSEAEKLFEELRDQRGLADAIAWRANVESRYGNYEDTAALGERLATIGEALDDPDITQWAQNFFGLALFGRAVVDGDRDAAKRNRVRAEARVSYDSESDSSFERAASLGDLAFALFAVGEYPESIATAQRSLRETHVEGTTFVVGLSLCGSGDFGRGVTLIAAARRQLRETASPKMHGSRQSSNRSRPRLVPSSETTATTRASGPVKRYLARTPSNSRSRFDLTTPTPVDGPHLRNNVREEGESS